MFERICIVALLSCGMAMGQPAASKALQIEPRAASVDAKPVSFEVASIRRNKTGIGGGEGVTDDGYNVKNMYPVMLISFAYGVSDFQRMQGLPEWCKFGSEGYDISAKVAEGDVAAWKTQGSKEFQSALQALLKDRFQLKTHFETRDVLGYALVVAKNGPSFKEATAGDTYQSGEHDREGKPAIGIRQKFDAGSDRGHMIAQAVSMATLAEYFSGFMSSPVGRPVVDKTGLAGQYDFSMPILSEWVSKNAAVDSEMSIFTTLEESLGLKLEPTKIPVEFLVIDHIERPSEN